MDLDRASLTLWQRQSTHLDLVSAVPDVIPMQSSLAAKPYRVHAMIAVTRLVGEAEHASSGECVGANPRERQSRSRRWKLYKCSSPSG
jgi:hypothetical protein